MANAASIRIPWRAINQRMTANPIISSTFLRAQPPARPSCRYESTEATAASTPPPPAASEALPSLIGERKYIPGDDPEVRLPRAVQAAYLRPLRRAATYHVPSCDLQMRSYSIRNLEFFADFAMRAAYFCGLPAYGPVPLPRIVENWTVPRGSFIHKKSQENFRRTTLRRLIQIKDGHPESVEVWLSFLRKHAYYGIGMKANVWNYESVGVGKTMDANIVEMKEQLDERWGRLAVKDTDTMVEAIDRINKGGRDSASMPPTRKLPPKDVRGYGYGPSVPLGTTRVIELDPDEFKDE